MKKINHQPQRWGANYLKNAKIGRKAKTKLYEKTHELIMQKRIEIKRELPDLPTQKSDSIDAILYSLNMELPQVVIDFFKD